MDKTDLKIIGLLARDCRLSYERIGSAINLTRNSIKTRIKKMVSEGVIQEFIADINFELIGYRICYIITKQGQEKDSRNNNTKGNNSSNSSNTRKIVIDQLNQIGEILAEIEILGAASIFRVAIREANEYKENTLADYNISSLLLDTGLIEKVIPVNSRSAQSCMYKNRKQQSYVTPTDLKILRCLVLNPQIGIADICKVVAISARTANRILNKLKDDRVVRFSVICDPTAMKGLVVFGLLIYVNQEGGAAIEEQKKSKKPNAHKILERLYTEFPEYPFLRLPLISHDNIIVVSVYGNDIYAIDSMFKRILSFEDVKKAELYVFTRIKYHKEWILREIDNKL
ncbi:MAG: winged helix-turn-helix transcriptional regulator [Nitrososphaeraceae archaeon]